MAVANVIFHGMMLFVEEGEYCNVLMPEIKEHDYRYGDPEKETTLPDDLDFLEQGDYTVYIKGLHQDRRPDTFEGKGQKYVVIHQFEAGVVKQLRRIGVRVPLPDRVLFFRKVIKDKAINGPIGQAVLGATPRRLVMDLPNDLHHLVVFHYCDVEECAISMSDDDSHQTLIENAANLCLYAETGQDFRNTGRPADKVHRTGVNDLLHDRSNGGHTSFELSKTGDAAPVKDPGYGMKEIHMESLWEMFRVDTNRSGCEGAAVSGARG